MAFCPKCAILGEQNCGQSRQWADQFDTDNETVTKDAELYRLGEGHTVRNKNRNEKQMHGAVGIRRRQLRMFMNYWRAS